MVERVPEVEKMFSSRYSILFLVPKRSVVDRAVLDLTHLHKFIRRTRFKMETLKSIVAVICQGISFHQST